VSPDLDVVIVGDGPAGAALAASCVGLGLDTVVVGQGTPWRSTYGVWLDEVPDLPQDVFAATRDRFVTVATTRREISRGYGVIDNAALRAHLGLDHHLVRDAMTRIRPHHALATVELLDGDRVSGRFVVDATGPARESPPAWQTGYGVVVDADVVHSQFTTDAVTLMDWSVVGDAPTFCYVVPTTRGWLVEETALATREPVDAGELRNRLARRLGEGVVADAEAAGWTEEVTIPIGLPARRATGRVVPFGAAAGMGHPVTGYSVAAALRAAPRVAQAIGADADVADAVWPRSALRARALHDAGLRAVLRLSPFETADLFEAFFAMPVERWAPYLRVDAEPQQLARAMAGVFRSVPWSVRRRLARVDPRLVARLVRG
jgi:lycopene beta-cyclase